MSVSSLLGLVRDKEARKLAKARERYVLLASNAANATEADAAELSGVMEVIGKSADDLAADLKALDDARLQRRLIAEEPQRKEASAAADLAVKQFREHREQEINRLNAELGQLILAAQTAGRRVFASSQAHQALSNLRAAHPDVIEGAEFKPAE